MLLYTSYPCNQKGPDREAFFISRIASIGAMAASFDRLVNHMVLRSVRSPGKFHRPDITGVNARLSGCSINSGLGT